MVNVYIKSFGRPFYLDRCIRSVKFNVRGYDRIIVLDDGTERRHLDRLREIHPQVEIRSSGADDGKLELLREQKFQEISMHYPDAPSFWVTEIGADPYRYTLVLEDDTWIVRSIDLPSMIKDLADNDALICKFWWSTHTHEIIAQHAAARGPNIEYFAVNEHLSQAARSIWIVAFALFRRDYWLHCVSRAKRLGDERSQFAAAIEFSAAQSTATFAKTGQRCLHQGWVIPARSTPEYYDKGLIQHLYMDVLNKAWLEGRLKPSEGYPHDFSHDYIVALLANNLPEGVVNAWDVWHRDEVSYFFG